MEKLPQFNDSYGLPFTYEHLYRTSVAPTERPTTTADPDLFIKSAKMSQSLLQDAKKVIDTCANSKQFSTRLMTAAQESNKAVVTSMIRQTGVKTVPDIKYSPDGLHLDFYPKNGEDICHIVVSLKWRSF